MCFILSNHAGAQSSFKSFIFEKAGDRKVTLDFKVLQNLIVIPVFLNSSDTLWFILDTGVRHTILLDLPQNDSLQMKGVRTLSLAGLGIGNTLDVLHSWDNTIRIPGLKGKNQDILIVQDSLFSISTNLGFPIHGIIGRALVEDLVVRVNYPLRTISFIDPNRFNPWWKGHKVKIELMGGKPYVEVPVTFPDGKTEVVKLLLDTGAGLSAAFFPGTNAYNIPADHIDGALGRGLSGNLSGKTARIQSLKIGKYEIDRPIVMFPDSQSVNIKPGQHYGIIGADILKRFNFYLSYRDEAIWLRSNRHFNNRFRYNTSGLDVRTPLPAYPVYEIEKVRSGSVGDEAGLQPGDQITFVDGKPAPQLKLNDVTRALSKKPGKKVKLVIERNGTERTVQLEMKEEL